MGRISTTIAYHLATQTVSNTALTLEAFTDISQEQVNRANRIRLTVETQPIRYRYDSTAPTTAVGHLLIAGTELVLVGQENIKQLQVIRSTGSDSTVMVTLEE